MYKILGADGRQYGPVDAGQLRRWIAEGRANAYTQTLAEGASEWKPLGSLPEFAPNFSSAAPPTISPAVTHYRHTSGYAIWGLICGFFALFFCWCCCPGIPLAALGLIFSLMGLSQITDFPDAFEGRTVAVAGIVLSAVALVLGLFLLWLDIAHGNVHYHYWHVRQF